MKFSEAAVQVSLTFLSRLILGGNCVRNTKLLAVNGLIIATRSIFHPFWPKKDTVSSKFVKQLENTSPGGLSSVFQIFSYCNTDFECLVSCVGHNYERYFHIVSKADFECLVNCVGHNYESGSHLSKLYLKFVLLTTHLYL